MVRQRARLVLLFAAGILSLEDRSIRQPMTTKTQPAAMCVTGQLRSLPAAYVNWKYGTLIRSTNADVDFFLVTSRTNSYSTWHSFITSLQPKKILAIDPRTTIQNNPKLNFSATLDAGLHLSINTANFPEFRDKAPALLMQLWQQSQCRRLILEHEHTSGVRYSRIVRVRSDVVVSDVFWTDQIDAAFGRSNQIEIIKAKKEKLLLSPYGAFMNCRSTGLSNCTQILISRQKDVLAACRGFLESLTLEDNWYINREVVSMGSRRVMLDGEFRGIELLRKLHLTNPSKKFGKIIEALTWINEMIHNSFTKLRSGGACALAIGDGDYLRMFGPPKQTFVLQVSEQETEFPVCIHNYNDANLCLKSMIQRWQLTPECLCANLGVDLKYDIPVMIPNGTDASAALKEHHSKNRLVGDWFPLGIVKGQPNRAWEHNERPYDGFDPGAPLRNCPSQRPPDTC